LPVLRSVLKSQQPLSPVWVKIALPEHHYQPEDKAEAVAEVAETVFEEVI
jgi:hypothetical protein